MAYNVSVPSVYSQSVTTHQKMIKKAYLPMRPNKNNHRLFFLKGKEGTL